MSTIVYYNSFQASLCVLYGNRPCNFIFKEGGKSLDDSVSKTCVQYVPGPIFIASPHRYETQNQEHIA